MSNQLLTESILCRLIKKFEFISFYALKWKQSRLKSNYNTGKRLIFLLKTVIPLCVSFKLPVATLQKRYPVMKI